MELNENGKIELSPQQYDDLQNIKSDMLKYKEKKRELESQVSQTADNTQQVSDLKSENQKLKVNGTLQMEAMKAGINNPQDISLIPEITLQEGDNLNDVASVAISNLKQSKPYLFNSESKPITVDTSSGSRPSGALTDDQLKALSGEQLIELKRSRESVYNQYVKLSKKGSKTGSMPGEVFRTAEQGGE